MFSTQKWGTSNDFPCLFPYSIPSSVIVIMKFIDPIAMVGNGDVCSTLWLKLDRIEGLPRLDEHRNHQVWQAKNQPSQCGSEIPYTLSTLYFASARALLNPSSLIFNKEKCNFNASSTFKRLTRSFDLVDSSMDPCRSAWSTRSQSKSILL